jgi:tetratricopeptide (TPR) repeat protein
MMGKFLLAVSICFAVTAVVVPVGAAADGSLDFAQSLMAEQDYFRAITELKEVKFFSTDERLRELCDIRIGEAYLWSNKYDMSISTFGRVLSAGGLDAERSGEVDLLLGLDYIGLRTFQVAEPYFQEALDSGNGFFPRLYLGVLRAEQGGWADSERSFAAAVEASQSEPQRALGVDLRDTVRRGTALPSRSPLLAGLLSTIIPGAGQVYTGHYVDAAQAFLAVAGLSFATYGFYLYDSSRGNDYILTGLGVIATAVFHAANIYGAAKTADYYNIKQLEDFLVPLREKAFSIHPEIR